MPNIYPEYSNTCYKSFPYTFLKGILSILILSFTFQCRAQLYNAEIMYSESSYTIDNNVLEESHYTAIKINNQQGDEYAKFVLPYQEDDNIYDIHGWIEDVNGKKLRILKKKEIADISVTYKSNLHDDIRAKFFELKSNVYPYIIKLKYSCKSKHFLCICDWMPDSISIPIHDAKLKVDIPLGYKVSFFQNKIDAPLTDTIHKRILMTWETKCDQPIKPEACSPSFSELVSRVFMVPLEFNYGVAGSNQNWVDFGNWVYNLNKGLDDLPPGEVQKVQDMIKGVSDKKQIVQLLYKYLQNNTRYVSIQVGIGDFKALPAGFVAQNRYGDCKALANYMKALLKVAGIPSCFVLVNAGIQPGNYRIINRFVASQFNHVILLVPLGSDSIWLDCTAKTCPAGYLGTFTQNRYVLVVNENSSKLVKIPALLPSNCYTLCHNTIEIDTTGNAFLKSSALCKGYSFDITTFFSKVLDKDMQRQYLYAILPYHDFEIKQVQIKNDSGDSACIALNYQLILESSVTFSGKYLFLELNEPRLPHFENASKRHYPVRITYPINYIDTIEITAPQKYRAEKKPNETIETKYGIVKVTYLIQGNKLEVCRHILLNTGEYPIEEYNDFYQFVTQIHKTIDIPVSFIKS